MAFLTQLFNYAMSQNSVQCSIIKSMFELYLCRALQNIASRSSKFINGCNQCDKANDERNVISMAFIRTFVQLLPPTTSSSTEHEQYSFESVEKCLLIAFWFDCPSVITFVSVTMTTTCDGVSKM